MVIPFLILAVESSDVIALRMMKLMSGDKDALDECHLMIGEKVDAAFEASASLLAGASGNDVIRRFCNGPRLVNPFLHRTARRGLASVRGRRGVAT
jgi:hypothetical protein